MIFLALLYDVGYHVEAEYEASRHERNVPIKGEAEKKKEFAVLNFEEKE